MKKILSQGEIVPKGYGLAYPLLDRRQYVIYPFPLNHVVRLLRDIWIKVRHSQIRQIERDIIKKIIDEENVLAAQILQLKKDREDFEEYKLLLFQSLKNLFIPTKD